MEPSRRRVEDCRRDKGEMCDKNLTDTDHKDKSFSVRNENMALRKSHPMSRSTQSINTLRTGDADLRFCVTNVQDG
jgi:hypothetical protein